MEEILQQLVKWIRVTEKRIVIGSVYAPIQSTF